MFFSRTFSVTNFIIASSALCFQVLVLYPWHHRLEKDFQELKREHLRTLHEVEEARIAELQRIMEGLNSLKTGRR
ncbi:hypothetical protein OIDMADRAFT_130390 [Oidiodendron maius Zn]|uniref:Uncharacterized protein n=1 Tax=Oidiodendron maius (strain Zn) TaxID=913774 RepID=A0A0C3CEE8_OIDMZ|nr:hypothetical protein OIDMADRAFT_130390 [Oidiodendron maius Zn]